MAKALSVDLRQRVVAAGFGVGVSSAIRWVQRSRTRGDLTPDMRGGNRRSCRIGARANDFRFYHAALWDDLFGRVGLMLEWSRIGRAGSLRLDRYSDRAQAQAALDALVQQKQRKGYRWLS